MSHIISVRLNEDEKNLLMKMVSVYGHGMSSLLKKLAFEKIEDEYDLQLIREYESDKHSEDYKTYSAEEAWKILDV